MRGIEIDEGEGGVMEQRASSEMLPEKLERTGKGIVGKKEGRGREEWLEATCIVLIRASSSFFLLILRVKYPF